MCSEREEDWSGELLLAHCEDLQKSEIAELYVNRFEYQGVVREECTRTSVCKRNSEISQQPTNVIKSRKKTSSQKVTMTSKKATGKKFPKFRDFLFTDIMMNLRSMLYNPDEEAFPIRHPRTGGTTTSGRGAHREGPRSCVVATR